MIARNFDCPETESPCVKTVCSRAHCSDAVRRREAQANKQIRSQSLPAFRGTIAPGRWYTLRNGERITIARKDFAIRKDAKGDLQKMPYWVGVLAGGATLTWQIDGYISPVAEGRPNELDIIGTAVRP